VAGDVAFDNAATAGHADGAACVIEKYPWFDAETLTNTLCYM